MRVCNSDDPPDAHLDKLCALPEIDDRYFNEVRIYTANWESSIFISWLLQIVLSELAGVPATVETGDSVTDSSFYDPLGGPFQYSDFYDGSFETFQQVKDLADNGGGGDCRKVIASNKDANTSTYQACFHIMPEIWEGENKEVQDLVYDGVVEPPDAVGYLGQETWFVTAFTAKEDPFVLSYRTIMGEEHRHRLAELFLRPTKWKDYCEEVSPNNCKTPDHVAQRPPNDASEYDRLFVEGLYTGHFRKTEKNDCVKHPTTCTGHFADYPNGWSSYFVPITHHFNIALESDGDEPGSGGYSYEGLMEVWRAANATNSNAMIQWSSPEWIYQEFLGTDAAFTAVELPTPTQECLDNRIGIEDRQSPDFSVRAGKPEGACGNPSFFPLHKLVSTVLRQQVMNSNIPEAVRSPALRILDVFYISKIRLDQMFRKLAAGDDAFPREAICEWVVENRDFLESFVPRTYPRALQEEPGGVFLYVSLALGCLAVAVVLATGAALYYNRHRRSVRLAQSTFLWILLSGAFAVAVGAVVIAAPPTDASCIAQAWLINLGYTLLLVPLIIKVGAINQLMIASKKMRRFALKISLLIAMVGFICSLVAVFLTLWTVFDPPKPHPEFELTDDKNADGETIVSVRYHCDSDSQTWNFVGVCWNTLLLLVATILAFQMRSVMRNSAHKGISEAKTLAFLIYSHFLFVGLRLLTYLLSSSVDAWTLRRYQSMIFSADTIASVLLYFLPKLYGKDAEKFGSTPGRSHMVATASSPFRNSNLSGHMLSQGTDSGDGGHTTIESIRRESLRKASMQNLFSRPARTQSTPETVQEEDYDVDEMEKLNSKLESQDAELAALKEEIIFLKNVGKSPLNFFKWSVASEADD